MIRKIKRFLIIIGVTLSGVFWIACGVQCADAKTGLLRSSPSMKASKEKGVFCFEMTPSQKKYNLTDSVMFKIKSVWVEYQWKTECVNNIPVLKKTNVLQMVISYDYEKDSLRYLLMEDKVSGKYLGDELSFYYENQDTVCLMLVDDKHNDSVLDSLLFFKK